MPAYVVTLNQASGRTLKDGVDAMVVFAADATAAKAAAASRYSGDSSWTNSSTAAEVAAVDWVGYRFRIYVEGTRIDVSFTGDATDNTIDKIAARLVTALNATSIDDAAYNSTTNVLTVAASDDNLGDHYITAEVYAPGAELPLTGVLGAITQGGAASDALTVALPADNAVIPSIQGRFRQVV